MANFHDRVGDDPDFAAGDAELEYVLQSPGEQEADGFYYPVIQSAPGYVSATAGRFLARGSKCLGTGLMLFRSGNPDVSLLSFYNASLFYVRGFAAMMGVVHYDFQQGDRRVQCQLDLFPGLAQPQIVKSIKVENLAMRTRVVYSANKFQHSDIFTGFEKLNASLTQPGTLAPFVAYGRSTKYKSVSSPRNSIIYGRDELPFGLGDVGRLGVATRFSNPFQFGISPFDGLGPAEVINFAWMAFSMCRETCSVFGGRGSVLADHWLETLYDGDTQEDFFNFYCQSGQSELGALRIP